MQLLSWRHMHDLTVMQLEMSRGRIGQLFKLLESHQPNGGVHNHAPFDHHGIIVIVKVPSRVRVQRPKTAAERKQRVAAILRGLDEMYPKATCALHHHNPWELLVATILSAQCTDKRVNEVTPGLFAKYPT